MPSAPFPVSGTVYDTKASAVTSGWVVVENFTKGTSTSIPIYSDGSYSGDLANAGTYATGDIIYIYAKGVDRNAEVRYIIKAGDAFIDQNLYMKAGEISTTECTLKTLVLSSTATQTVSIVDRVTDEAILVHLEANKTKNVLFERPGKTYSGGFRIIVGALGTSIYNQSTGTANTLGDKATNVAKSFYAVFL